MTLRLAVLGARGFIGKNLMLRIAETPGLQGMAIGRDMPRQEALGALRTSDVIINLAGVNRPPSASDFLPGTLEPIELVLDAIARKSTKVLHVSSARAGDGSDYGAAKFAGEEKLRSAFVDGSLHIFRFPNVFGKWAKPNYNSAVATFCHNISRGLPITVNDRKAALRLAYIDDVVADLITVASKPEPGQHVQDAPYAWQTTVGEVVDTIRSFHDKRQRNEIAEVGTGLTRALYSTYIAGLDHSAFAYEIKANADARGTFSEVLRTPSCGQFSYFSALPGITRGGHYHHSKVEKFLVVYGKARFRFRHMLTNELQVIDVDASRPTIVETIPGWTHDVTNTGDEVMLAMLWANEIFDPTKPDTILEKV
jgi:UDP-2-acetamido-2,6-beta-L-arabino-hexul-4-ose reductase